MPPLPACPAIPARLPAGELRAFPDIDCALTEPNGLLAIGGELNQHNLLLAYRHGIFPWYSAQEPLLWWSPAPRAVLRPDTVKISRSLKKTLRHRGFTLTMDEAFIEVIRHCSEPRRYSDGTWITPDMQRAYIELHQAGYAHSVECWFEQQLVGGLYGLAIGKLFFGESMFSRLSDASKVALIALAQQLQRWEYRLIDCQVGSPHTYSLGAFDISREALKQYLTRYSHPTDYRRGSWQLDPTLPTTP
ncbi:leucyl/phenylalanyl-tRNA--protein transferase [Ectothiorhodospiraceae bacterium BW-2]|nr:leucyl/phenylalanyl-tRNA--protein transferase [Ectothiorhodospiraceae bacterium BW-2]